MKLQHTTTNSKGFFGLEVLNTVFKMSFTNTNHFHIWYGKSNKCAFRTKSPPSTLTTLIVNLSQYNVIKCIFIYIEHVKMKHQRYLNIKKVLIMPYYDISIRFSTTFTKASHKSSL